MSNVTIKHWELRERNEVPGISFPQGSGTLAVTGDSDVSSRVAPRGPYQQVCTPPLSSVAFSCLPFGLIKRPRRPGGPSIETALCRSFAKGPVARRRARRGPPPPNTLLCVLLLQPQKHEASPVRPDPTPAGTRQDGRHVSDARRRSELFARVSSLGLRDTKAVAPLSPNYRCVN